MTSSEASNPRTPTLLDPDLRQWLDLPGVERLLDPDTMAEWLHTTLGVGPVRLHRLRAKPGHSLVVGWERTDPTVTGLDRYGWAGIFTDRHKIDGVLRRARRTGAAVAQDAQNVQIAHDTGMLMAGTTASDPGLARDLAHARRRLPRTAVLEVLAYNPGRRLVLAVDLVAGAPRSARRVLRIATRRQDHVVSAAQQWRGFGAPTPPVHPYGRRGTAVLSPWWGDGDLAAHPDPVSAARAGEAIARLHRASARREPHDHTGSRTAQRSGALRSDRSRVIEPVGDLMPDLRGELAALEDVLTGAGGWTGEVGVVHGDLSPDQVLRSPDQPGQSRGEGEIRIVDLDRSGVGPAGLDVGSWLAACAVSGQPALAESFLDGYSSVTPVPEHSAWKARALLAAALEPFRRGQADWRNEVRVRVGLASEAVGLTPQPVMS